MSHPSDEILRRLAACQLDDDQETDRIEEHLENCPNCRDKVAAFERAMLPGAVSNQSIEQSEDKSEDHSAPIPETIGHYQILGILGGGGMGTVYRGVNPHLNRPVAIKVVKSSRGFHQSSIERFQRELLAIGKLQHPNIVVAFDAGEYENSPYLVMELPEGTDLARYVKENGQLPAKDACNIIRQTALGLQHAHDAGMVHRDIKPSNLWLTPDGTVKILDFGLVGFLESEEPIARLHETMDGAILGSPDYISPEQIANSKKVDHRSDIYSLGCTFYYLLTGTPPFGETTELLAKLDAHSKNDLPPLKNYRNDVPAFVENLLQKMTAKKKEERPQSAAEVAAAIQKPVSGYKQNPNIGGVMVLQTFFLMGRKEFTRFQRNGSVESIETFHPDKAVSVDAQDGGFSPAHWDEPTIDCCTLPHNNQRSFLLELAEFVRIYQANENRHCYPAIDL